MDGGLKTVSALAAILIILACAGLVSCDSSIHSCFGTNLEAGPCPAETILSAGANEGLACYECVGEESGEFFNLFWTFAPLSGTSNPGVMFGVLNTTDRWLTEFTDCSTISLYVAETDQLGRFFKGDFAGTLSDLDPFQIDRLSMIMDIPGFRTEPVTCRFCADSTPPACYQPPIYYY
jgi:hypothetical protein